MRFRAVLVLALFLLATFAWGAQLRQLAIVDIPGQPGFDEAVFANGMLVLSHQASGTLDIFDPARRRIVAQVQGMSGPHGLAVDPRGFRVYVANADGRNVAVVSSKDWKVERTIPLESAPNDLMLSPDGQRLFVANWRSRSLSVIDLPGDKVATESIAGSPANMVFDTARRVLFVTLQDTAEVVAVDPATLKVVNRYKLAASQPTGLALDAASRRLYVAVRFAVVTLDADGGNEIGRVAAPAGADSMWLDTASGVLYVASAGGYINVFRAGGTLTNLEEIRTDVRGHTVAFDPQRRLVYLPGGREGRSKLLILKQVAPLANPEDQRQQQVAAR